MLRFSTKIKAGALQFATLISIVIAVLVSSFLLLTFTKLKFSKQLSLSAKTIALSHSGISYSLSQSYNYNEDFIPNQILESEESLTLQKSHWGVYDKLISKAQIKKFTHEKIAFLGGQIDQADRPALYLEDTNNPLVVVGETKITGLAKLPVKGVRAGNIAGVYYNGERLIYGDIQNSLAELPAISAEKTDHLRQLLYGQNQDNGFDQVALKFDESNDYSFAGKPSLYFNPGIISLSNIKISGNIVIKSGSRIQVYPSAELANVILVAPEIIIANQTKGSFQAIASQKINVGENCKLTYPSAFVLLNELMSNVESGADIPQVTIGSGSQLFGNLVYFGKSETPGRSPAVFIDDQASIYGEVYCENILDLKGQVLGSVMANRFSTAAGGSVYLNHILNGEIDVSLLPNSFVGLQSSLHTLGIAQWVY